MSTGIVCTTGRLLQMLLAIGTSAFPLLAAVRPPIMPVHEVLQDENQDLVPDRHGRTLTVRGVLTSRPAHSEVGAVAHLQDDTGGLVLFSTDSDAFRNFAQGDLVEVRGKVWQTAGMEELHIKPSDMRLISSGEVPKPRDVWARDLSSERFSGQLIRVRGRLVVREVGDQPTFVLQDETGIIPLILPPTFLMHNQGELNFQLWNGGTGEVVGIAGQNKAQPPFDGGYGIIPRAPDDIRFDAPPPPPPSHAPLYTAIGLAAFLGLAAIYLWDRRRSAERRTREVANLLEELRRSEAEARKQAAFPRFSPNPVLEFARDGTLAYFNDAASAMTARLGKADLNELFPPDVGSIVRECLESNGSRINCQVRLGRHTLSWSFFPIAETNSIHAYGLDVTEPLELEAQLRQVQKLESVGHLAAGIAHDFNNLVAVIQGYSSLTLLRGDLPENVSEALHEIFTAAERATALTRQLLAFSRKHVLEPHPVELNNLVSNLTRMLRRLLGEEVDLQFRACPEETWLHADPGMIEQVVMNLAVNARDAMPEGGRIEIEVNSVNLGKRDVESRLEARAGQFVRLTVRDSGCGMDEEVLKNIFEPFFTTKEPGKGTGLGLATVHGIVKQHQGWIEVSSRPGIGSTFRILLPQINAPTIHANGKVIPLPAATGSETLLVVEDDPALRRFAGCALEAYGYRVHTAGTAKEALAIWAEHGERIPLLLTDVVLPDGMSGWRLAETLQRERPELKVIYSTGFDLESVKRRLNGGHGRGATGDRITMLRKPYPVQALIRTVRDHLDNGAATEPATVHGAVHG